MKAFISAACVTVVLAFAAYFVLDGQFQSDSTTAFTTEGARLTPVDAGSVEN